MHLKIEQVSEGLHPNEAVIKVETLEGARHLIVSRRSIDQNRIEVGVIRENDRSFLVELPRETQLGEWRVWVDKRLVDERALA